MPRRNRRPPESEGHALAARLTAEYAWRLGQRGKHMAEEAEKRTRRGTRGGVNRTEENA